MVQLRYVLSAQIWDDSFEIFNLCIGVVSLNGWLVACQMVTSEGFIK